MIGITITHVAYAAIAPILPPSLAVEPFDGRCKIWLPRSAVEQLRALRGPQESFSDVIVRLKDDGSLASVIRSEPRSGPDA